MSLGNTVLHEILHQVCRKMKLVQPMKDTVDATVAALIGMIPEGLYLLTSVALAVSMMRLARRKVLTRDMNCIETLARVDTLCVDKTGTITESAMQADNPLPLAENEPLDAILASFYAGEQPDNDTGRALAARFGQGGTGWFARCSVPFNTAYSFNNEMYRNYRSNGTGSCKNQGKNAGCHNYIQSPYGFL